MQQLSPSALLDTWERGVTLPPIQRALLLLATGFPEESTATLALRSIGERNALLLILREWLFGPQFVGTVRCSQCGERMEFNFVTADIWATPHEKPGESLTLEMAGYTMHFRLPNSTDLAALSGDEDLALAEQMILERCLLSVSYADERLGTASLPQEVVTAVIEAMDRADPQANIQLSLACPVCNHQWSALLDLSTYIWRELDAWARRALYEVHTMASAYGWHEHDILDMRPWRRQFYMEMIGR